MLDVTTPAPLATPAAAPPACRHHWLVASLPSEGSYPAWCRRCGAGRRFPCLSDRFDFNDAIGRLGPVIHDEPGGGSATAPDDVARWAEARSDSEGASAAAAD